MIRGWLPVLAAVMGLLPLVCAAARPVHFDPDTDPSRMSWSLVAKTLGPAPNVRGKRFGVVLKTLTNEYWRMVAAGYRRRAAIDGVKLDIQAAQSESDASRQLAMMENMVGGRYAALLVSPQSDSNLQPAIDDADMAGIPIVDVDGAVVDSVTHFVGAVNREMGARVANWFLGHVPGGGKVAVIEGSPGIYSTVQRTAGFRSALLASKRFELVASVSGHWERNQARDIAIDLLGRFPNLIGIYCNNDTMALGAVDAVKSLNRLAQVRVFGNDGTRDAYTSIKAGELTGTVDIFPMIAAEIGLDLAERLSVGQKAPRVIETPQAVITRDNAGRYEGDYDAVKKALMEDAAAGR